MARTRALPFLWSVSFLGLLIGLCSARVEAADQSTSEFFAAVKQADRAAVRELLAKDPSISNVAESDGTTPLHVAAHDDDVQMAALLLDAGAKADVSNRYGATPLWLAARNGSAAMIELLVKAGATPNTSTVGELPLHAAARSGRPEAVESLLKAGATVDAVEAERGQTALMHAAAENYPTVVRVLLESGANARARTPGGWTAILFAARAGAHEIVRDLLKAGADVNDALQIPGAGGSRASRNPDGNGVDVLTMAIVNGYYDLATWLLDHGADSRADASGRTPLHALIQVHNWEGIGSSPRIVEEGDYLALIEALLARGADPNARMTRPWFTGQVTDIGQANAIGLIGSTPLWWAARDADVPALRLLLAAGADPLLGTTEQTTPLMVAAGVGHLDNQTPGTEPQALEAVKLLVDAGAKINEANVCQPKGKVVVPNYVTEGALGILCGWTPLHGAASRGRDSIAQYLVDHGANLHAKDIFGRTPLMIAQGHVVYFSVYKRDSTAALLAKLMGNAPEVSSQTVQSQR